MEITACPVCGSKNIGIGTLGDGIISGLSSWNEVCRNCGYQGASLVFESEGEYQKFLEALAYQKKQAKAKDAIEGTSQQRVDAATTTHSQKKNYLFEFLVSIVLTIVFFMVISISQYAGVYSDVYAHNNLETLMVYILGSFGGVFLFFLLCIILVETLVRSIQARKK